MKKPSKKWINALFILALVVVLSYWAWLLRQSLLAQYGDDTARLAGFLRWLLGFVFLFGVLSLLGWLNFRIPFRRWYLPVEKRAWYYLWLVGLALIIFELLQWRTWHELELVEENLLVTLAIMAYVMGFTYVADSLRARRDQVKILQQKTAAELHNLRAQLNPHFLFNALNTLYSQALKEDNDAQAQLISKLSGILRFTLQQARQEEVSISEEIEFLQRYIALQEARLQDNPQVQIEVDLDWDGVEVGIPPLLLIPFVENAFLYGVSAEHPSRIRIQLQVEGGMLEFKTENTRVPTIRHKGTGQGIANTRQRLALLYPNRHELQIQETATLFQVLLRLELEKVLNKTPAALNI